MCWPKRCCFFVPLDLGCIILGIASLIISTFMTISSMVLIVMEHGHQNNLLAGEKGPQEHFLNHIIPKSKTSIDIIVGVTQFVGILWMLFSILLILGIQKNKPSFVLSSFAFGIVLTILSQLGALLILIDTYWIPATLLFIFSSINIHYLVVVHTVYEMMVRGKQFGLGQHRELDEESILGNQSQQ